MFYLITSHICCSDSNSSTTPYPWIILLENYSGEGLTKNVDHSSAQLNFSLFISYLSLMRETQCMILCYCTTTLQRRQYFNQSATNTILDRYIHTKVNFLVQQSWRGGQQLLLLLLTIVTFGQLVCQFLCQFACQLVCQIWNCFWIFSFHF